MNAKHTPGLWKVFFKNGILSVMAGGGVVVHWTGFDEPNFPKETKLANAHLIAAAPDLLDSLEELLDITPFATNEFDRQVRDRARAAIRKAKGETV